MRKRHTWKGAVLGAGLALIASFVPAGAQSADHPGDTQKPVVTTYDKRPDPKGENQKIDALRYEQSNPINDISTTKGDEQKPVTNTYDKKPDPKGDNQKLDSIRYNEQNVDSEGAKVAPNGELKDGDKQKTPLSTYTSPPASQSTRPEDVATVEERAGDQQKPVVDTYDKRPDPKGDAQKLDAVRYEQQNDANDGRGTELNMKVLEGSVEE